MNWVSYSKELNKVTNIRKKKHLIKANAVFIVVSTIYQSYKSIRSHDISKM